LRIKEQETRLTLQEHDDDDDDDDDGGNVLCLARSISLKICGLSTGTVKHCEVKRSPIRWTNLNNEARNISDS